MKIGEFATYISFLEDEVTQKQLIQLVSEDKEQWKFRVDSTDDVHLIVSKKGGFDRTWYSGPNKTIKRRTLITPF